MWDDDWARLGIAPTTELVAIKKAYALKLKVTRPDDDAEAYQALRAAYERAQQWAAWARAHPEEAGLDATEGAAPAEASPPPPPPAPPTPEPAPHDPAPPPVAPERTPLPGAETWQDEPPRTAAPAQPPDDAPAPPAAPDLAPPLAPRSLIDALELAWRRDGDAALMQAWREVRATLDAQPLARQAEFSAAFAHWLVNLPQLPDPFVQALDAQFGWRGDFRTERLIGPALAQAVLATLAERLPQPVDPSLRRAADPLLRLVRLRETGRWGLMPLALLMLHPTLAQLHAGLGPSLLRRLGLDLATQTWLREAIQRGLWLRVGLCALAFVATAWLMTPNAVEVIGKTGAWAGSLCLLMLVGAFGGSFVNTGPGLTVGGRRRQLPLTAWRQNRLQPQLGLVWLLFSAWLLYLAGDVADDPRSHLVLTLLPHWAWLLASFGFGVAGLFAAWPLVPLHGLLVASLAPFVAFLFEAAFGAWLPGAGAACVGLAWLLAGAAVAVRRLPSPAPVVWLCRPVINTLVLAERWSYSLAMLPLAAAVGWLALREGEASMLTVFALWAVGLVVTARVQAALDTAALRWLPPAPADEA